MNPVPYFVGYTLAAARTPRVRPVPSNYKDPAKIAEAEAKNREAALELAPKIPTCGAVEAYHMIDATGVRVSSWQGDGRGGEAARRLLRAVQTRILTHGDLAAIRLVGFGVHALMRVACLEVMATNTADGAGIIPVPSGLYRGEESLLDPYLHLLHTSDREHVPLPDLLAYLGIDYDPALADSPVYQADLALGLARWAQLAGMTAAAPVSLSH